MDTIAVRTLPYDLLRDLNFIIAETLCVLDVSEDDADEKLGQPIAALVLGEMRERYFAIPFPQMVDHADLRRAASERTAELVGQGERAEEAFVAARLEWLNAFHRPKRVSTFWHDDLPTILQGIGL